MCKLLDLADRKCREVEDLQLEIEKQNEALKENAVMISGMSSDVMILQERNKKLQEENEKLKEEN